ncbi:aminotransferase class V-fold PLP-dependent enzyme [Pseudoduganella ginsengisoli]|uniref:cysteine desulfurase n=1 Tax=Pseudoduganella ginsengisoli TaxID=1462440 RepID=A0A6L6Q2G1_9BURK|nr:aminotransferase class V-fold PLP-dependent enzyme [Pseudoduganella ginsengisoli]MTW03604.1 aminotransferase class V-fold PLP-dependent enzyme [Pseudoduganella ginsengisoli]
MTREIYLDGNATSPVLPAAIDAAVHAMQLCYGNPSSTHTTGLQARALLNSARERAMRVIGAGNGRVMFNSGATEGIQTAVLSSLCALRARRDAGEAIGTLLVYGATEHKAVPQSLSHWNTVLGLNLELAALPVDGNGLHDLDALRALAPRAAMVCTMAANNETGVLSDIAGIEAVLNDTACTAYWMVDCVQALGKFRLQLANSRIDYAPFSGHKLYAPKGIGMLYVRDGAPFTPLIVGGGQESALRSGTENMAGIAALDAVLAALEQGGVFRTHDQLCDFRDRLAASLRRAFPGIVFNAPFEHALPTTLNFSVPGLTSRELMDVFDAGGVRVSSGSACSSAKAAPSYVLEAMGVPAWRGASAIRMSFGPLADDAMIAAACGQIERCGVILNAAGKGVSGEAAAPYVLQLGSGGDCSWLVLDGASNTAVVIDPCAEHDERIAAQLEYHGCRMLAVLSTSPRPGLAMAGIDSYGWPLDREALVFGGQRLERADCGAGQQAYLLGTDIGTELPRAAVRHAFIGNAAPQQLSAFVHDDTLLCAARDEHQPVCSSLRVTRRQPGDMESDMHLDSESLHKLLADYPNALLVDVRESGEHAASGIGAPGAGPDGRTVLSVPLGRLTSHIGGWLQSGVPLVFCCRSGARSAKAAACLRRLGHLHAYDLAGGMALTSWHRLPHAA